ncbi:MAG: HD domain-containing protein, partial [Acidobacteria bacterium]|nr:HD domain-containing protein [Acidobacteriota bacterium]
MKALEVGALLHDIGKLAVPEHLLTKPGRLTRREFNQIAIHPQVGAEILAAVKFPFPVAELVHSHHENWDGTGYPRGLVGSQIPLTARILSVVDCFDALISDRPYRPAFPLEKAVQMIELRSGATFDPKVVETLLEVLPEVQKGAAEADTGLSLQSPRAIDAIQTSMNAEELEDSAESPVSEMEFPASEPMRRLLDPRGSGLQV